jgi:hypothetical protein
VSPTLYRDTGYSLNHLIEDIKGGRIGLPDIQRVGAEYRVTGLDLGFRRARWFGSGRIAGWLCGCCT